VLEAEEEDNPFGRTMGLAIEEQMIEICNGQRSKRDMKAM